MSRTHVLQAFVESPWAILPYKLEALKEIVARHAAGEKLSAEEIEARIHGATRPLERRVNSVAVLPLFGTIFPRANLMTQMSGATSAERFSMQFAELVKDPEVGAIVIDVNSPGGSVYGVEEAAKQIFEARGTKPIIAVANHLAASAAYWIASAADELVVSPSGEVGSIGVFATHEDVSGFLEKEGVKTTLISEGKFKTEGNPYEPLGEEARAAIHTRVSEYYDAFVEAVARQRGVNPDSVRNGFGQGRVVGAAEAVKLGMADRVETIGETVYRLLNNSNVPAASRAAAADPSDAVQEPAAESHPHKHEARARLEPVASKTLEGDTPMLRTLINQRAEKVARAQQIVELADAEERDLNEAERAEMTQLLGEGDSTGEIGALDAQIEKIQDERARVRQAAEKQFATYADAQKPDGGNAAQQTMTRSEFNKLDPKDRLAFSKAGGKITD